MSDRFAIVFLFILSLHISDSSLLSRFRNPYEIVAPEESMAPDELEPSTYDGVLEEVPELRTYLGRARSKEPLRMLYLNDSGNWSEEYDFMVNGTDIADNASDFSTTIRSRNASASRSEQAPKGARLVQQRRVTDGIHKYWRLSRFRNPNEILALEDSMALEELEPGTYDGLLEEVPELRTYLGRVRSKDSLRVPNLKDSGDWREEYEFMLNATDVADSDMTTINSRNASAARRYWPGSYPNKKWWGPAEWSHYNKYWRGPKKASCYRCGDSRDRSSKLPLSPICHDAFESQDWRAKTQVRFLRAHCYYNKYNSLRCKREAKTVFEKKFERDYGLTRGCYGVYSGGCYKRFLDVGKVYTTRGCRSWPPWVHHSSAYTDHRFRKLEFVLRGVKEGCVVSPHASLTPFSRGISLYVRYHICVCNSRYCNSAGPLLLPLLLLHALILIQLVL